MAERTRRVQSKETWTWDSAGRNWKTGGRETWGGGQKKKWRLRWEKEKTPNDSRCSDWTGKHRAFKNRYLIENNKLCLLTYFRWTHNYFPTDKDFESQVRRVSTRT